MALDVPDWELEDELLLELLLLEDELLLDELEFDELLLLLLLDDSHGQSLQLVQWA